MYKGLLHRQHEVRREVLYDDSAWRSFKPPVRIELPHPIRPVLFGLLRPKIEIYLLTALGLLGNAEVLVDDGDEHLQYDNYRCLQLATVIELGGKVTHSLRRRTTQQ